MPPTAVVAAPGHQPSGETRPGAKSMEALGRNAAEGQKAMQQLYASVESALALATRCRRELCGNGLSGSSPVW
jgi:hypothetical protein